MHRLLLLTLLSFASPLICAAEITGSEELIFKFTRGGMSGWTTAWSGVVVKVKGNTVKPTFAFLRGVLPPLKYYHNKTLAIKACAKSESYFDENVECLTAKDSFIVLPDGKSPYDYKYQFIHVVPTEEWAGPSKQEESFVLDRESAKAAVKKKAEKQEKDLERKRSSGRSAEW